ncbi:MAG: TrkH family potassium uptake protein [Lachnospiraceae bacterium]|jgi:trk system potassium uptake protein TrkH
MNYGLVKYVLGYALRFEAIFLLLPGVTAVIYREKAGVAYAAVAVICCLLGFFCSWKRPKDTSLYAKEGFVIVSLSWLVLSLFGALPLVISGDIPNFTDAVFEMVSGFTTTGASILPDVEALQYSNLFWRSFSHWLGGMGVFVLMMAILPLAGGYDMNMMKAESTGPVVGKLLPKVRDTASVLYKIYFILTVTEFVILLFWGMPVFEAMTTTFGTVGTGGFGVKADSLASYRPAIQNTVTIFMVLSGINFSAYFFILMKKPLQVLKMEDVRTYLGIILASSLLIGWNIRDLYDSVGETLRHAFFQVGSIITTTGFATVDYEQWPEFSKMILVCLMFIGACSGSTGGGIKVSRILILVKAIKKELNSLIHPRAVRQIFIDQHVVTDGVVHSVAIFIGLHFLILLGSTLLISLDNFGFTTNFTAVAATINNIGPGLADVGPTMNFAGFSAFSKWILIFDMLAGRLELMPVLLLLSRNSWKKY